MRILLINQFYLPDRVATAQVLADLCDHLAAGGHDVHVLCSRRPFDEGAGLDRILPRRERIGRVAVERVGGTAFGKRRLVGQLLDCATFLLLALSRVLISARRYDVVITLTTPPLLGLVGTVARLTGRARRHVCWVMNLHPDCEVALGLLRPQSLLARPLDRLNAWHMRRADATVAVGECMADRIRGKGVSPDRVTVIPLWAHGINTAPIPAVDSPVRARWGLEGRFVVMYSGNAGVEYTFDEFCAAALALREDPRFAFVFVGGGRRTAEIDRFRRAHRLDSIHLYPYVPRSELHAMLSAADVHLACLRPELAGVSVPCKLYGVMAVARPVFFVGPAACATADTIRTADCGRTFAIGDAEGLVKSLRELADDRSLCTRLGAASRRAYERTFNADARCDQWIELLERVAADPESRLAARETTPPLRSPATG